MRTWMKGWGTSDSTTKLGCDVNIKSIHEEEFWNKCVGSLINWCNPSWGSYNFNSTTFEARFIMTILVYHLQDLASKSPIIVVRKEPFCARVSKVISKLSKVSR